MHDQQLLTVLYHLIETGETMSVFVCRCGGVGVAVYIHNTQFPIHNTQFPIHNTQFPIHNTPTCRCLWLLPPASTPKVAPCDRMPCSCMCVYVFVGYVLHVCMYEACNVVCTPQCSDHMSTASAVCVAVTHAHTFVHPPPLHVHHTYKTHGNSNTHLDNPMQCACTIITDRHKPSMPSMPST